MNAETLQALKGSIEKWRLIENQGAQDLGSENCPLCILYHPVCSICPVWKRTRERGCLGTPYDKWRWHLEVEHDGEREGGYSGVQCAECVRLARNEREFLESLLPKEEAHK